MDKERAKMTVVHLLMLLHYHERITLGGMTCNGKPCDAINEMCDPYAEDLREAIRCVKIVNQIEN